MSELEQPKENTLDIDKLLDALWWAHEETCDSSKRGRKALALIIEDIGYGKFDIGYGTFEEWMQQYE